MTRKEFSEGFDTLVNSYRRFRRFDSQEAVDSIEFDEFEKSFFLSKAQEELVEALYAGESIEGESYEETERLRRSLAKLNEEKQFNAITNTSTYKPISDNSKFFKLEDDILFITFEGVIPGDTEADCYSGKMIETVPVRQDWYHRQVNNPFRGISAKRALRLDLSDNVVEIVYPLSSFKYYVRYVRRPKPIVLETLPDGLTIYGKGTYSDCELDKRLHTKILERGVLMGLRSKGFHFQNRENKE